MKGTILTLFFISFFAMISKIILPKGEKSPFYPALKVLTSLMLILTVFSPFFHLEELANEPLPSFDSDSYGGAPEAIGKSILQKSADGMQTSAEKAFPEIEFSLRVEADENYVPNLIRVFCEEGEDGKKIALFLQSNYEILSVWEEGKQNEDEKAEAEL